MAEIKTRPIGKALFSVNFEPTGQAPLDARLVVENMETLLANETYVDRGNNFYEGMPVIVKQGKSGKSELWVLIDGTKVTEEAGWQRLDADGAAIDGNIEDAINGLNATVSAEGAHVSVGVVETKGKLTEITVTEDDIASATELTNTIKKIGTGFDATNTVAKAISDEASNRDEAITNAINGLNATVSAEGAHVSVGVVETKGKLTEITVTEDDIASATELTNTIKKIGTGFDATNTVAKAISDEASNRDEAITNAINNLNNTDIEKDGQFVTKVSESGGIITVTRQTVAADKVTATAITDSDTTVAVAGNNVADQIASLGQTLKTVEGNAAKYKVVKLTPEEVTDLGDSNVKEAYKVVSYVGAETGSTVYTKVGEVIKIYKDANLESAELGTGENAQKLILTYILADGTRKPVPIDFKAIAFESEFKDGLAVAPNGEISVKRDVASEDFLTVGADGVKLDGVKAAIDAAVANKNVDAEGDNYITATASDNKVSVSADVQSLTVTSIEGVDSTITGTALSLVDGAEVANKVSNFTNARISEEIAKLDVSDIGEEGKFITKVSEVDGKIAAEFVQVKANEVKLEQIGEVDANGIKLNAATVQEGIAELFIKILDNEEVDAAAINEIKTILGITGEELKYETKSDDTIIGAATSYSDADVKLAEAIRTAQDNTITIQAGNGVNITSNGSEKTINVKVVNDDKLITVDNSGIHTKDNAVFDCGIY